MLNIVYKYSKKANYYENGVVKMDFQDFRSELPE